MFESSYLPRWVGFDDGHWTGTEGHDMIQPILGAPFPNDYPFKKYYLGSDAPIYENSPNFPNMGPPNLNVSVRTAIQKGKLYDLSKIEKSRTKPLLVVKLFTGEYNIITFNQNLILTEEDLEPYRVPILINGFEMKTLDWADPESIEASTLTTRVHFDSSGSTFPEAPESVSNGTFNRGQIYLLIKKQANPDGTPIIAGNYSRILGAELVTFDQLWAKNVFENRGGLFAIKDKNPYMKDKVSITMMESYTHARYEGVGAASILAINKAVGFNLDDASPFFLKAYQESVARQTRYTQIFRFQGRFGSGDEQNFNDHFFCRV